MKKTETAEAKEMTLEQQLNERNGQFSVSQKETTEMKPMNHDGLGQNE